jgi:hypothetical protein
VWELVPEGGRRVKEGVKEAKCSENVIYLGMKMEK